MNNQTLPLLPDVEPPAKLARILCTDLLDLSGNYGIVLADPPWSIQTTAQVPSGRPTARPYVAMRMCDIYALPVAKIAAKDSLLFLWATAPLIPEALYAMKAWGYEYKTVAFTWVKRNKGGGDGWFWGMGWWTRSNPEYCLLGMKGSPKRAAANVHSVIEAPVGEHSKKPSKVRDEIVRLCGDLPRVELFARERTPGWDAWGNEV
jgi:N6-adenosine-specific RNA methylase IME4